MTDNSAQRMPWTPGPWKVNQKSMIGPVSREDASYGMVLPLCDVYGDNREADGKLIAEAPAMAELLRDLEVCVNTVAYCYTNRPENFAAALRDMKDKAAEARELLTRIGA